MVEILCHREPGEVLLMAEILHHLGCMKSHKLWDKLPTSTGDCRISAINSRVLVLQRWRAIPVLLRWLLWWEPGSGTMPQHEFQDPSYMWIMYIWAGYGRYMETTNMWFVERATLLVQLVCLPPIKNNTRGWRCVFRWHIQNSNML